MKRFTRYWDLVTCILVILAGGAAIVQAQDNGTIFPLVGGNVEEFYHLSFSKDGSKLVGVSQSYTRVWNARTGELIIQFDSMAWSGYMSAEFSPDGTRVVVAGEALENNDSGTVDYFIRIFDVETGAEIRRINGHPTAAFRASYINDGKNIISFGEDYKFYIWDVESGGLKKTISIPGFSYYFSISPDEKYIAATRSFWGGETPQWKSSIRIIDLASGDSVKEIVFVDSTVLGVKWAHNSDDLAVCMYKDLEGYKREFVPLRIINVWTEDVLKIYDYPNVYAGIVDISSNNMIAVSSGNPSPIPEVALAAPQVNMWMGTSTGQPVTHKTLSLVTHLTFSPNGDQIAFARVNSDTAYIWNLPAISDAPVTGPIDRGMAITCMPNPASSELHISYRLSSPGTIRLSLVDAIGSTLSVLLDKPVEAGSHSLPLNVDELPPGIYYCYAQMNGQVSVCPIHVVR